MVVGTVSTASRLLSGEVHLLYLDGDVDSVAPNPEKCVGSAGMGLWLLTQDSEYWDGTRISPSQITVIGNKKPPETDVGISCISLQDLRNSDIQVAMKRVLSSIPKETHILVHFDVDLLSEKDMPAAYAPREEGLSLREAETMLKTILSDGRVRYLEFSEFIPNKDPDGKFIRSLIGIFTTALAKGY